MERERFITEVLAAEKQMYGIAKSILKNDTDCETAVRGAILHAYAKAGRLRNENGFRIWMTRILIRECCRMTGKGKRFRAYAGAVESIGDERRGKEYSEIYEVLMALKRPYRLAFVLYYVEGYSLRETAESLWISENSAKQRVFRGRERMKNLLKGERGYER